MTLLPFKKRIFVRNYAVASAHKSEKKPVEEISKKPWKLKIVSTVGIAKQGPRGDNGKADQKKTLAKTVSRKFFSINPMGECREVLQSELPMKKRIIVGEREYSLGEHNRNIDENKIVNDWKDNIDEKTRLKKPKIMKEEAVVDQEGLNPPPESDLPVQFKSRIREMNGTEPKLVIQKSLTESDLNRHCNRFAIPRGKLKTTNFLTKEEHDTVDKIKGASIEVILLDPALREFKLNFIRWQMGTSFTYNLTSGWTEVVKNNNYLKQYDWVQLWCFQRGFNSCLALVHLPHGQRNGEEAESSCSGNTT